MINLVWLIPLFPLLGFLVNGLGRNTLSKSVVAFVACLAVLASFAVSLGVFFELNASESKSFVIHFCLGFVIYLIIGFFPAF
jgi:NADH-quinone oxidoreductase subunit L